MQEANQEKEKRTTQFLERGPSRVARVTNVVPGGHSSSAATARRFHLASHQATKPRRKPAEDGGSGGGSSNSSAIASRRHHHSYPHHHHHLQSANPELMRRPLKERLIHLLAVRPYKKPELLARISRDGIHEKDKRNISLILKQVSIMKDNVYNLLRHLWNDVSEDWPFYTEQERQSFRRRKPQNLTPPCSDGSTSSSGRSPASTHPASPPHVTSVPSTSSPPGKRGYGGMDGDGSSPVPKRRRVSNYVRPPDAKTPVHGGGSDYLNGGSHSPNGRLPQQHHHHQARTSPLHRLNKGSPLRGSPGRVSPSNGHLQHHHQRAVIQESNKSPWRALQQQQQQQQQQAPGCRQQVDTVIASSPDRGATTTTTTAAAPSAAATPSLGLGPVSESKRSGYQKDFARSFPPILNQDQRLRYKAEFNRFYARYMELHNGLGKISKRFADLEDRLHKEEIGTEVWRVSST